LAQTKRAYLIEKGLAKEGRGRLSAKAHDAIKDAINKGVQFSDGSESNSAGFGETPEPRPDRPEGMYTFTNPDGSTFKRLHTVACATCCYSIQWCYCVEGPLLFPYPHIPFQPEDARATLSVVPSRAAVVTELQPRRRRGRPRKQAA
jgi:hypothetical protein